VTAGCLEHSRPVMMSAPKRDKFFVFNHKRAAETKSYAPIAAAHA
jgi:hypothetical protein